MVQSKTYIPKPRCLRRVSGRPSLCTQSTLPHRSTSHIQSCCSHRPRKVEGFHRRGLSSSPSHIENYFVASRVWQMSAQMHTAGIEWVRDNQAQRSARCTLTNSAGYKRYDRIPGLGRQSRYRPRRSEDRPCISKSRCRPSSSCTDVAAAFYP